MRSGRLAASVIACLAWAAPALAGATGLATVPTCDLVPQRGVFLQFQNTNTSARDEPTFWRQPWPIAQSQFGLLPSLEAGVDVAPVDSPGDFRAQFNAKWRFFGEDYERPALAAGIAQLGSGLDPAGYLVLTRTLNYTEIRNRIFRAHHRNIKLRGRRLHAGLFRQRGATFPMLGADFELSDRWVLVGDWIGGDGRTLNAGPTYVFNASSSLALYAVRSNDSGRVDGVLISFTHTLSW